MKNDIRIGWGLFPQNPQCYVKKVTVIVESSRLTGFDPTLTQLGMCVCFDFAVIFWRTPYLQIFNLFFFGGGDVKVTFEIKKGSNK